MNNKKLVIRKVPLNKFLTLLGDLYNSGADFVDLHGEINEEKKEDNITVAVPIEYMSEESQASEEPGPPPAPGLEEESEEVIEITEEAIADLLRNV